MQDKKKRKRNISPFFSLHCCNVEQCCNRNVDEEKTTKLAKWGFKTVVQLLLSKIQSLGHPITGLITFNFALGNVLAIM